MASKGATVGPMRMVLGFASDVAVGVNNEAAEVGEQCDMRMVR